MEECMKNMAKKPESEKKTMNKHDIKILHFLTALQDCYIDEDKRESAVIEKLELSNEELTDDFFAIIQAFYILYKKITGDDEIDLLGFTHLLNRLVFQFMNLDEESEE